MQEKKKLPHMRRHALRPTSYEVIYLQLDEEQILCAVVGEFRGAAACVFLFGQLAEIVNVGATTLKAELLFILFNVLYTGG